MTFFVKSRDLTSSPPPLAAGESPMPGDVVAQRIPYVGATGHVAIVGREGTVIGTSGSVEPAGTIAQKPLPERFSPNPNAGPMVFRRYVGP